MCAQWVTEKNVTNRQFDVICKDMSSVLAGNINFLQGPCRGVYDDRIVLVINTMLYQQNMNFSSFVGELRKWGEKCGCPPKKPLTSPWIIDNDSPHVEVLN